MLKKTGKLPENGPVFLSPDEIEAKNLQPYWVGWETLHPQRRIQGDRGLGSLENSSLRKGDVQLWLTFAYHLRETAEESLTLCFPIVMMA